MAAFMEITQESTEPLIISFVPSDEHANINGFVHGGYLFFLCDELVGRYVKAIGRRGAAADSNIQYYRPAHLRQKLYAGISERKSGKKLGTYLVELRDEERTLIADALFTVAFKEE